MAHAKSRIKVSFVCFNAYKLFDSHSSAQLGGTELQMHTLAMALAGDSRFAVSFIVGDFGQPRIAKHGSITVVSAFRLDKAILNLLLAPIYFFRALLVCKADIIISSPAGPEIGLLALYCIVFRRTKYIFRTASDVDCDGQKEKSFDVISGFLYRLGIRRAHTVITQHAAQQSSLLTHYDAQSTVIANGYALPSSTIAITKRGRRILWVGSSRNVKRADIFFSLVRDFSQYQFDMILSTSGDQALYQAHEATAKTLSNLTFHGERSPQETNIFISSSRVLLGTSDYEGSPNTYIMASLYGTPIVSLNVPCQGVCVNGDYDEAKQKIMKLMQEDAYAEEVGERERMYAQDHYDIVKIIAKWISVIQEMYYSQTH